MAAILPCVKCGAILSGLVEGTTATCFFCGTLNVQLESTTLLSQFIQEAFNIIKLPPIDGSEKLAPEILEKRIKDLQECFQNTLNEKTVAKDHIIVSKIDDVDINATEILQLARSFGMLAISAANFILPSIKGSIRLRELQSIIIGATIENLSLVGLYHAILGKKSFDDKQAMSYFQQAARCYQKIVDTLSLDENKALSLDFSTEARIFECAQNFGELLAKAVFENPAYYSDEIEKIALKMKQIEEQPACGQVLLGQVMDFYELAKSVMFIMQELRNANSIWLIDAYQEKILLYIADTLEGVIRGAAWVKEIYSKFKEIQNKLQRLHCGHILDYLKTYRNEFENRYAETTAKFDHILDTIETNSFADYGLECVELFDRFEVLLGQKFDADITINRIAAFRDEVEELDTILKNFLNGIAKNAFEAEFPHKTQRDLISAISDQHGQFDLKILDYVNLLFSQFMDQRNEQRWILEKQRETYLTELKPRVKRLLNASYTLHEDKLPYPLFMELIVLKTVLVTGKAQRVLLLIENPSDVPVQNLRFSFLVPKSFDIVKRYSRLKLLKPHEKRAISTLIIPTESGTFHLMSMLQYEHLYEKYWLPSFKVSIEVLSESAEGASLTSSDDLPPDLPLSPEDRQFIKKIVSNGNQMGDDFSDEDEVTSEGDEEEDDGSEQDVEEPDEGPNKAGTQANPVSTNKGKDQNPSPK